MKMQLVNDFVCHEWGIPLYATHEVVNERGERLFRGSEAECSVWMEMKTRIKEHLSYIPPIGKGESE